MELDKIIESMRGYAAMNPGGLIPIGQAMLLIDEIARLETEAEDSYYVIRGLEIELDWRGKVGSQD